MTTMKDLTHGARVRHPNWNQTGTVLVAGGQVFVHWDNADAGVDSPVTEDGYLTPGFLEVIGEAS